ncbi:CueP family metal-binding protein [Georgenia faecalis]|uniref:CueP family metal-binding protein n=1 Tax=Georgenia faecalis TaxID=2483799 RepID=UPI000FD86AED|nr:CueP family metal-binding protein [Georgenia faecalis]
MRRRTITMVTAVLVLAGCSSGTTAGEDASETLPAAGTSTGASASEEASADDPLLLAYDLAGMEPTEIIEHLDALGGAERPADLMASVRVDELLLSDASGELTLALPEDRFYLSVAPYVDQTHECFYHSLTTCQGELTGEAVEVTVLDDAGDVILNEERTTAENGFVGMWLPRDVEGTVRITADGRTGEVPFSTGDDGATCLTTLQLA